MTDTPNLRVIIASSRHRVIASSTSYVFDREPYSPVPKM